MRTENGMSKSTLDIAHEHGQEMYRLGIEHAINMIEVAGDDALELLRKKLEGLKEQS